MLEPLIAGLVRIDLGEDGSNDAQGQGSRVADSWYYDLDVDSSAWGTWAHFDVTGQAATLFGFIEDPEFFESRIPYTVDVILTLDVTEPRDIAFEQKPDYYSDLDPATPSENYDASMDGMDVSMEEVEAPLPLPDGDEDDDAASDPLNAALPDDVDDPQRVNLPEREESQGLAAQFSTIQRKS